MAERKANERLLNLLDDIDTLLAQVREQAHQLEEKAEVDADDR